MSLPTQQQEEYIHFDSSVADLQRSWTILNEIKRNFESPLVGPAFQFAIIEYAKPYKNSKGRLRRNYRLDASCIPPERLELHNRLLDSRDTIIAHSDLDVRDAKLHVADLSFGRSVGITQNNIHATEEISNLDDIIDLIERTILLMLEKEKLLNAELTPND